MDDAGVGDRLAIGVGGRHLGKERGQHGVVRQRVLGPVGDEQLGVDAARRDLGRRVERAVEADAGHHQRVRRAGDLEHGAAAEAEADRAEPAVAARVHLQGFESRGGASDKVRRVGAELADPFQPFLKVGRCPALPIDVGSERDITEFSCDPVGPALGMVADAADVGEDRDAGGLHGPRRQCDRTATRRAGVIVIERLGHGGSPRSTSHP